MAKRGKGSAQRTLEACRKQGRLVWKVEQWVSYGKPGFTKPGMPAGTRRDAFNFIDIIAIDADAIVAIQACGSDKKAHFEKIIANEYALPWLQAGGKIEIWAWRKLKVKRGGIAVRWTPLVEHVTEEMFNLKEEDHG